MLIPPSDYAQLNLIANPRLTSGPNLELGEEGNGCRFQTISDDFVDVDIVTNYGISRWIDGDVNGAIVTEVPKVLGYRAITEHNRYYSGRPHESCRMYVDLADDQSLMVETADNSDYAANNEPTCVIARRYAESAMRTLTGR